jgi:hypothetical protein
MRARLSYANVMATIAVFIALGGASYAAIKLPKNSVGTRQLKKNAVNGAKVADHSLRAVDIGGAVARASNADEATHAKNADHAAMADHATTADRAATADNAIQAATAANGATGVDYDEHDGTPATPILKLGDLTLNAECASGSSGFETDLIITGLSTKAGEINWDGDEKLEGASPATRVEGGELPPNETREIFHIGSTFGKWYELDGQFVYRDDDGEIMIALHSIANNGIRSCAVSGVAIPAP